MSVSVAGRGGATVEWKASKVILLFNILSVDVRNAPKDTENAQAKKKWEIFNVICRYHTIFFLCQHHHHHYTFNDLNGFRHPQSFQSRFRFVTYFFLGWISFFSAFHLLVCYLAGVTWSRTKYECKSYTYFYILSLCLCCFLFVLLLGLFKRQMTTRAIDNIILYIRRCSNHLNRTPWLTYC